MQDDLSLLIKLQERDLVVDDLHQQVTSVGPLIEKKNSQLEQLKTNLKVAKDKLSTHQKKRKELELDAESKEALVKKHQGELNSLKSNDSYKAMLGEIDAAKKAQSQIEDQILELMAAVESDERQYKEAEKQFKADEAKIKAEVQALEGKKAELGSEAQKKQDERNAYAQTVPEKLRTQYDIIREKRGGVAIVPLVHGACAGCRMNVTMAKANEIHKAKSMVLCDSCLRILYYVAEEPTPAAPAAPSSTPTAA